jgi:hypothetical protein
MLKVLKLSIFVLTSISYGALQPKSLKSFQVEELNRLALISSTLLWGFKASAINKPQNIECPVCLREEFCLCGSVLLNSELDDYPSYYPRNERIFDTLHKSFIPARPEKFIANDLNGKNVIAIGEVHSNPCHHRLEFEIIR